uniref:F-box/LRR-repeat protein 15-like leucin rich repeat domain-containing protein n=1 Tax=Salix viminalis TaxID=40686 RepID=A0A6N2LQ21_SALVM
MEGLPNYLISEEILWKMLDLETLCTMACVSKSLRFSVDNEVLPYLASLDLSNVSIDEQSLYRILNRLKSVNTLTLNCQRLGDSSLLPFLAPQIQQLNLFRCSLLSSSVLNCIGANCPFLRAHLLFLFRKNVAYMLSKCRYLEDLSLKIKGTEVDSSAFQSIEFSLPRSIKFLKLKPVLENNAIHLANRLRVSKSPSSSGFVLQFLSLLLDVISDRLLVAISKSLPLLAELHLEDRPHKEPSDDRDLTNYGLHFIGSCRFLTDLSLIRSRQNYQGSFKRINDMGMFQLAQTCTDLESVKLSGFSKVSDAGFASLLQSCQRLKKFEVRNAFLMSDLAFHDIIQAPCTLAEVRLLYCGLITSETVKKLAFSRSLEVLDLCGCKSVADSCLGSISCLQRLTTLNLTGAHITDSGLSVIGQGNTPISYLCLRGCKRITDKGISFLLCGGGAIAQTLSALDLGYIPGISDNGILTIATFGREITELCIRNCFHVTDLALRALATKRWSQDRSKRLCRVDIFNCVGLSADALKLLRKPLFHGLHWIGIGKTHLTSNEDTMITEIQKERPWLTLCFNGCEMECHDGWQFHSP